MTAPVVIVGGGITGLAAAHQLSRQGRDFVVLEASDRLGGKIAGGAVTNSALPFDVDMAADGFLAREPEMSDLCRELGLGDDLVSPVGGGAYVWVEGTLRPIPAGLLGVPIDLDSVEASGILSPTGISELRMRIAADVDALESDATVGATLRPRMGDEAFERLVDPLLGGINAGNADEMSINAGARVLADAARKSGPFHDAIKAHVSSAPPGPVFQGVRGGSQRILDALEQELGDSVRTGVAARSLHRDPAGWTVSTDQGDIAADQLILTSPGWVTADLLAPHAPEAASVLADLDYGDAVLLTFVVDRSTVEDPLDGAGFLVPRDQGLLMTACSWSSSKWAHYDDGTHAILRVSAGRTDDTRWLSLDDDELIKRLTEELAITVGLRGKPVVRVTPWRQSLPQYKPGHLQRADRIDAVLAADAPGVVVAGASMRGLGLPACVRQGRNAASGLADRGVGLA